MNNLNKLEASGQDIWLDLISRSLITKGDLARLIEFDSLAGVTSNPTIFEKAIDETPDYDQSIRYEAARKRNAYDIAESCIIYDITAAADQFRTLYERSKGRRGYVSIEVSPHLAYDTDGTIKEARHLWNAVNRPNIFIKVPATREGLPAITELISEGINVNITLLFGLTRYREVAQAYIDGICKRLDQGKTVDHIASVASFFLSRIDVLVDRILEEKIKRGGEMGKTAVSLKGKIAIASAVTAYHLYKTIFTNKSFTSIISKGAQPQRLLWASTSTKNPLYSDTMYIEPLIGPDTISTQTLETIESYRNHGNPAVRINDLLPSCQHDLDTLASIDIDIEAVSLQLEKEGVEKFAKSFDKLIATLEKKLANQL